MTHVFKKTPAVYEEKDVKFADAVMGYRGFEKGISEELPFGEEYFKRIEGLKAHRLS